MHRRIRPAATAVVADSSDGSGDGDRGSGDGDGDGDDWAMAMAMATTGQWRWQPQRKCRTLPRTCRSRLAGEPVRSDTHDVFDLPRSPASRLLQITAASGQCDEFAAISRPRHRRIRPVATAVVADTSDGSGDGDRGSGDGDGDDGAMAMATPTQMPDVAPNL
ncbi:hypothetical protein LT42_15740 [Pseudomonas lutea]|uniref:Uncharacterized protein n=1 Tax=Pseudomonas lutea TaxID=243924 RepID=A0A9X0ECR0_9PSED|nr:hypothetical protein LT42_15740 [Pseudomonas lutea]